ncbi:MAG: hypothetical protein NC395_06840 [Prevotella sp.]|nr:hypothetical protein [Prevotella sp.]
MLEMKLLLLLGICLAAVPINCFTLARLCRSEEKSAVPIIAVPLTKDMETPEFIVRNCIYPVAERCPEAIAAAIDFDADSETLQIFEKLMEHSCRYMIIKGDECRENFRNLAESMI